MQTQLPQDGSRVRSPYRGLANRGGRASVLASRCLLAAAALVAAFGAAAQADDKIVIAHRGASGYLPEHTLEAYAFAYALGADYIEPDLVRTKDGAFISMHDIHLESTTNVEEVFPDRHREDGKWYAADFTLAEIKTLRAEERLPKRFPQGASSFQVPTLQEVIELVQGLNATTGRHVGIYPELKSPAFHEKEGLAMEADALAILKQYGYEGPDALCYVQCFEHPTLKKIREELHSELPLIALVADHKLMAHVITDEGLDELAKYANGIGPDKELLTKDPTLVARAHAHGLKVHPYTVRRDQKPSRYDTTADEYHYILVEQDADGLFSDFPDDAVKALGR
ncbi:MAG: glycerophosphodiester phosphodiesterase [Candidatus Hydrogenedens sp.]|nr:glycerophosphodiester phosphodiesterase [Candidatus Hydrogenedens sp.]